MATTRIYLDACCLNRPTDDLTIDRNRLEAEAVLAIVAHAERGDWDVVTSAAIEFEINQCSDARRREAALALNSAATHATDVGETEYRRAGELVRLQFGNMDALHVACAESGHCDVLLSTDDKFVRRAARERKRLLVAVENPLDWLMERQL